MEHSDKWAGRALSEGVGRDDQELAFCVVTGEARGKASSGALGKKVCSLFTQVHVHMHTRTHTPVKGG